jgi:protein-arginine kinase activator protein McsA
MPERTERMKQTQKAYYEKCKTSEEFIKKRNEYNANYYQTKLKLNPIWRQQRIEYSTNYNRKKLKKNKEIKEQTRMKERKEQLLLKILIEDKEVERNIKN